MSAADKRRTVAGRKLAKVLDKAADAAHDFVRARIDCNDDPRAGQPNDAVVQMRDNMREYAAFLEATLGRPA